MPVPSKVRYSETVLMRWLRESSGIFILEDSLLKNFFDLNLTQTTMLFFMHFYYTVLSLVANKILKLFVFKNLIKYLKSEKEYVVVIYKKVKHQYQIRIIPGIKGQFNI